MLVALKVKIASLAAESRIIRRNERKSLCAATYLLIRSRLMAANIPERSIARIMKRARARGVALPHITPDMLEGRNTGALFSNHFDDDKLPEYINGHQVQYEKLRAHRVCEMAVTGKDSRRDNSVRSETRHALLAYGFLRGRNFKAMEDKSYVPPSFKRVEEIARRFADWGDGGAIADQIFAQRFAEWKHAAGEWQHPDLAEQGVAADHE